MGGTFSAGPDVCVFCDTPARLGWVRQWLGRRGEAHEVEQYEGGAALVAVRSGEVREQLLRSMYGEKKKSDKIGREGIAREAG